MYYTKKGGGENVPQQMCAKMRLGFCGRIDNLVIYRRRGISVLCRSCCDNTYPLPEKLLLGGLSMKFVVIDNPKFFGFFLRKMFGIKKLKNDNT